MGQGRTLGLVMPGVLIGSPALRQVTCSSLEETAGQWREERESLPASKAGMAATITSPGLTIQSPSMTPHCRETHSALGLSSEIPGTSCRTPAQSTEHVYWGWRWLLGLPWQRLCPRPSKLRSVGPVAWVPAFFIKEIWS